MKERPIIFNGDMVRAILAGRKTQTRRILKPQLHLNYMEVGCRNSDWHPLEYPDGTWDFSTSHEANNLAGPWRCPYGVVGDRLWVRETHAIVPRTAYARSEGTEQMLRPDDKHEAAIFKEGWVRSPPCRWRPSIHMPRWASRITLEVVSVRIERLQGISESDATAEGVHYHTYKDDWGDTRKPGWRYAEDRYAGTAAHGFECLWELINGPGSWQENPWVWVIEFTRVAIGGEA